MRGSQSDDETSHLLKKEKTHVLTGSYTVPGTSDVPNILIKHHPSTTRINESITLTWKHVTVSVSPQPKGMCSGISCCGRQTEARVEPPKQILRDGEQWS